MEGARMGEELSRRFLAMIQVRLGRSGWVGEGWMLACWRVGGCVSG